jgi:hypothetical protein
MRTLTNAYSVLRNGLMSNPTRMILSERDSSVDRRSDYEGPLRIGSGMRFEVPFLI